MILKYPLYCPPLIPRLGVHNAYAVTVRYICHCQNNRVTTDAVTFIGTFKRSNNRKTDTAHKSHICTVRPSTSAMCHRAPIGHHRLAAADLSRRAGRLWGNFPVGQSPASDGSRLTAYSTPADVFTGQTAGCGDGGDSAELENGNRQRFVVSPARRRREMRLWLAS